MTCSRHVQSDRGSGPASRVWLEVSLAGEARVDREMQVVFLTRLPYSCDPRLVALEGKEEQSTKTGITEPRRLVLEHGAMMQTEGIGDDRETEGLHSLT